MWCKQKAFQARKSIARDSDTRDTDHKKYRMIKNAPERMSGDDGTVVKNKKLEQNFCCGVSTMYSEQETRQQDMRIIKNTDIK